MNFQPNDDFLDMLMSGQGEAYLDREIEKLRLQIGEEQFQEFAHEYFQKEGDQNIYANKKQQSTHQIPLQINIPQQHHNSVLSNEEIEAKFLTQPQQPTGQHAQQSILKQEHVQNQPKQIVQINQQQNDDTTNNEQDGIIEISRQAMEDGKMKIKYNNGDQYEGEMQGDLKSGWGTYFYSNGEKYSGCFIEDEIHGYGRYYFLGGADYEGDWSSGMKHGIGILKFPNQDVYEGGFAKDEFYGNGIYRYHNGDIFTGKWRFGKKQGEGKFEGKDGHLQIGNWVDDQFTI